MSRLSGTCYVSKSLQFVLVKAFNESEVGLKSKGMLINKTENLKIEEQR
jgi:hypothetical protein